MNTANFRGYVARTVGAVVRAVADTIVPHVCIVSGAPLASVQNMRVFGVHPEVVDVLPPAPFPNELLGGIARHFDPTTLLIDEAHSLWQACTEVLQIIHGVKYGGKQRMAEGVGSLLGAMLVHRGVQASVLIPVPIHTSRLRERGYNQAELIANGVARASGIPVRTNVLRRVRSTGTQTALRAAERRANLAESIEAVPCAELEGATVVIIDDVLTTGTTLNTCAWALATAGVRRCIVATVAAA